MISDMEVDSSTTSTLIDISTPIIEVETTIPIEIKEVDSIEIDVLPSIINNNESSTPPPPPSSDAVPQASTSASVIEDNNTPPPPPAKDESTTPTREITPPREEEIIKEKGPTEEELELQAQKKRKLAVVADESKKRSKRMFGLLQSTLQQAKKQVSSVKVGGQNIKFQEVQERLNREKLIMEEKRTRGREEKDLREQIDRKLAEIGVSESIYKARHNSKLSLASFLCTKVTVPPVMAAPDGITTPYLPLLPHATKLPPSITARPIYYLPNKLLPDQEDQLEDQLAAVKKSIRREKEDWDEIKGEKMVEINHLKAKREKLVEDVERGEKELKQRKRREEEDREERLREGREAVKEAEAKKMQVEESVEVIETEKVVVEEEEVKDSVVVEESVFSIKGAATSNTEVPVEDEMEW